MSDTAEVWHRECTNTVYADDEFGCGVRVEHRVTDKETGEPIPIEQPDFGRSTCGLCGSKWGPWIAGPAPE